MLVNEDAPTAAQVWSDLQATNQRMSKFEDRLADFINKVESTMQASNASKEQANLTADELVVDKAGADDAAKGTRYLQNGVPSD